MIHGDARQLPLADGSVQCVVTSPPYWGLRDYGLAPSVWDDGWRGVLGLEPTPELYVAHLVQVFRDVKRVLRDDGVVWLNLGDSYASTGPGSWGSSDKSTLTTGSRNGAWAPGNTIGVTPRRESGLKPKDLVGIPWRVAFALQADGWYLRADVIWAKPNPMPESVTDRPTKAHEYLFLLSKQPTYFYDAEAVREKGDESTFRMNPRYWQLAEHGPYRSNNRIAEDPRVRSSYPVKYMTGMRNKRTVWTIATEPYPDAHFATFPEALVAPCILAGTSERGACAACGAPWERVVARERPAEQTARQRHLVRAQQNGDLCTGGIRSTTFGLPAAEMPTHTAGWRPTCECATTHVCTTYCLEACSGRCLPQTVPCLVLDPFAGSGTVGAVAERLGRRWVGVDLKPEYLAMAQRRTAQMGLVFLEPVNGHGHHRPVEVAGAL